MRYLYITLLIALTSFRIATVASPMSAQHHLCEQLAAARCPGRAAAARRTRRQQRRRCSAEATSKPKGFGKRSDGGADTDKDARNAEELSVDLGVREALHSNVLSCFWSLDALRNALIPTLNSEARPFDSYAQGT